FDQVFGLCRFNRHCFYYSPPPSVGGVSVSHRRVNVGVAHNRRDRCRGLAGIRCSGAEGVTQVMESEALNTCLLTRRFKACLNVVEGDAIFSCGKKKLALGCLAKSQQLLPDFRVHGYETITVTFSLGGLDFICVKIDILPFESKNLTSSHTRVQRQHDDRSQMGSTAI